MNAKKPQTATSWIEVLRAACTGGSQREVARKIGYSGTVVSLVLKGTYKGDLSRVRAAVEGALMQSEVDCPVCGVIPRQRCVEHQRKPFMVTSDMRIALYMACRRGCEHALNSASDTARSAQPAVAQNTGSTDGSSPFSAATGPSGGRKPLPRTKDEVPQ